MQQAMHRVVVLALPGVFPFELGIPAKAFGLAYGPDGDRLYEVLTCTPDGRPVRTSEDFSIAVEHDAGVIATADTLIVAAIDDPIGGSDPLPKPVAAALGQLRPGTRLVSICTASFVLAAAGLLDGRPATTHWIHAERFRELYPRTPLDPDVLYVDDDDVLTSAGAAAGMDLCLHLIRRDHGSEIANQVARICVVPPWRDGGQAQYIARPVPDATGSDTAGAREWALRQLHQPIQLAQLATQAGMSVRTFSRRFLAETGQTPASGSPSNGSNSPAGYWSPAICRWTGSPSAPGSAAPPRCASTWPPQSASHPPRTAVPSRAGTTVWPAVSR